MGIQIIRGEDLTDAKRKEVKDFTRLCFANDKFDEMVAKYYFAPAFAHILMLEDAKLVSYLRLIKREIEWNGHKFLLGGIGDVAVLPEYRGKGLAHELLNKASEVLSQEDIDIALLQTNVEEGGSLYGSIGFVPANKDSEYTDVDGNPATVKAKDAMIAPIKNKPLFEEILSPTSPIMNIGHGSW